MKTVFFDVDTQLDFVSPGGALYVPGAERIIGTVAALNRRAKSLGHGLVSTVDAHPEDDIEFKVWKPHCVAGTLGQRKPQDTSMHQCIFSKTTTDAFLHPGMLPLLRDLGGERYVVYGVVTEICVRFAALGLLKTGAKVEVLTDAVKELSLPAMQQFYADFESRGGVLTTTATVL